MPNQKKFTPNSILDVKQYIFSDSNGGFAFSDRLFGKFKKCLQIL